MPLYPHRLHNIVDSQKLFLILNLEIDPMVLAWTFQCSFDISFLFLDWYVEIEIALQNTWVMYWGCITRIHTDSTIDESVAE